MVENHYKSGGRGESIQCPGLPPVIALLITFPAADETTPSLMADELANAVSKLKPLVFVFLRQTDPCCQVDLFVFVYINEISLILQCIYLCLRFERITAFLISHGTSGP